MRSEAPFLTPVMATRTLEGEGFEVRRPVPGPGGEAIGPFILLDHFGPIHNPPGEAKGAPWHPHAGIETISYFLEGRSQHQDSLGNISAMGPGEVQWMRAGRGVLHDEGPDAELRRDGGSVHGFQIWLNMPRERKHEAPAYRHFPAGEIPSLETEGCVARLIAGAFEGAIGPVETYGAPFLLHLAPGARREVALPAGEAGLYVAVGAVRLGSGERVPAGAFVDLGGWSTITVTAEVDTDLLILGGPPLDAPIVRYGPFVMNTPEQIHQAFADYRSGRMGVIPKKAG
jgi:quercetin 2,3-dioxygenase